MKEIETKVKNMGAYSIHYRNCYAKEQDGEHGLSHLVEHCLCENVKKFESKLKENGIQWNASTGINEIVFYMSGIDKNVRKFINKFTKTILTTEVTPEVFERERNIVIAEYKQQFDNEFARFCINFERKHYNHSTVIGVLSDLENITYDKFIEFKNRIISNPSVIYYMHPKTKRKFEFDDELKALVKETGEEKEFLKLKFDEKGSDKFKFDYFKTGTSEERIITIHSNFKYKTKKEQIKYITLSKILNRYLTDGLTSYLYQEIREKLGNVYSISGGHDIFDKEINMQFYLMTSNDYKDKVINKIKKSLEKLKNHINRRKFNIVIKSICQNYIVNDSLNYYSPDLFVDEIDLGVKELITGKKITFDDFVKFTLEFIDNYKIFTDESYI